MAEFIIQDNINFNRARKLLWEQCVEGLHKAGVRILGVSMERVPYRTGQLLDSANIFGPEDHGKEAVVVLSYGDEEVDYAVPVHEDLSARHPRGQSKFLESAVADAADNIATEIAREVRL